MKKTLLILLVLGLSACTTFAPPRPPSCDNSIEGMRPINPDMLSVEDLADWKAQKEKTEADKLSQVETFNTYEN